MWQRRLPPLLLLLLQVFYTARASIPDVALPSSTTPQPRDQQQQQQQQPAPDQPQDLIVFDSLKSLPTQLPPAAAAPPPPPGAPAASGSGRLNQAAVEAVAGWLTQHLGLTLFGFDVVVPVAAAGTYLVIDVNYFPNYRGGEGGSAAAGLCRTLRQQWERHAAGKR
jgi:hypothetical protein